MWLGLDVGNGEVEAFLKPNTVEDLSEFNVMFNDKIRKEICDKHLWFSLILRPQCSPFTRLQRLSCCLSFLCTTMIASAMFYGVGPQPGDTSGNFHVGPLTMNLRTIIIAIQSALVVVPVNVVIVACFRLSAPVPEQHEENRRRFFRRCFPSCRCRSCRDGSAHNFREDERNRKHELEKAQKQGALDLHDVEIEFNKSQKEDGTVNVDGEPDITEKDSQDGNRTVNVDGEPDITDKDSQDVTKSSKDNLENALYEIDREVNEKEINQDRKMNKHHAEVDNESDEKCKCCSCFYRLKAVG